MFKLFVGRVVPAVILGAKSLRQLIVASHAVRYYNTTGRPLTAALMRWNPRLQNFALAWKSLQERKEEERPKTPGISRQLQILP